MNLQEGGREGEERLRERERERENDGVLKKIRKYKLEN
jgi:hypothetical protein